VMASTHPYVFYGTAQGFGAIGSGKLVNPAGATKQMLDDLVVAGWLKAMSEDPSRDASVVLADRRQYWNDPARAGTIQMLVEHQGSLKYSNPATLTFEFLIPLPTFGRPVPSPGATAS
jgi:hypothetical protein